jgi:hypothetical protein
VVRQPLPPLAGVASRDLVLRLIEASSPTSESNDRSPDVSPSSFRLQCKGPVNLTGPDIAYLRDMQKSLRSSEPRGMDVASMNPTMVTSIHADEASVNTHLALEATAQSPLRSESSHHP